MPSKLLGPDFEDFTITCGNRRWLHSCRWEGAQAETFGIVRRQLPGSIGKAPNLVKNKSHPSPMVSGRWLLLGEDDEALAWAELQNFPKQHDRWGLLFWGTLSNFEQHDESVSRLISLCFIVGKFDHLRLVAATGAEAQFLDTLALSLGEKREMRGFPPSPWFPSGPPYLRHLSLELGRREWVSASVAQDPSKTLQHIQNRIARFEKSQKFLAPKQKKRSLLARFMRPKIDDPLF